MVQADLSARDVRRYGNYFSAFHSFLFIDFYYCPTVVALSLSTMKFRFPETHDETSLLIWKYPFPTGSDNHRQIIFTIFVVN